MKIKTLLKIGLPLLAIGSTIAIATPMVVSCSSEQSPSQTQTPNLPDTTKPGEENKPIVPDQPKPEPTPPQTGLNILKSGRINGIETTSVNDFAKATFSVRSESGKSLNAGQSRIKVLYDSGLLKFNNLEHKDKIYFKFMNVEANEADGTLKVYSYAYNENYVDAVCEPKMVILEQPIVLSGFRKEVAPTPDIQKYLSVNSLDGQTEFDVQRFVQESGGKVVIPQNIDKLWFSGDSYWSDSLYPQWDGFITSVEFENPQNIIELDATFNGINISNIDWTQFTNLTRLGIQAEKSHLSGVLDLSKTKLVELTGIVSGNEITDFKLPTTLTENVNGIFKLNISYNKLTYLDFTNFKIEASRFKPVFCDGTMNEDGTYSSSANCNLKTINGPSWYVGPDVIWNMLGFRNQEEFKKIYEFDRTDPNPNNYFWINKNLK